MSDEASDIVDRIKTQLEGLRAKWVGQPLHFEEVLANVVFWGSILTRFYPESVEAAEKLITGMDVSGETFERQEEKTKWN